MRVGTEVWVPASTPLPLASFDLVRERGNGRTKRTRMFLNVFGTFQMSIDPRMLYALWSHVFNLKCIECVSPRMMSELLDRVHNSEDVLREELERVMEVCDLVPDDVTVTLDPRMCLRALRRAGTI